MKLNRLYLLFILLFLQVISVKAQTAISGKIVNSKGEGIPGANIFIQDSYDGASSNVNGEFYFETQQEGEKSLVVSSIGYHPYKTLIKCGKGPIVRNLVLKEKIDQLTAVTITAGAMEASDVKKAVVMKPLDIVTTSGAMGDIISAFNKLPGTATVGNDGRLFVRGGDASETNIYMDGLQVGNAYGTTATNMPTRSRFNPILFKGSFFSTGGYTAEYGQALSSALVLNTIDMPARNQTDLSLMSIGGSLSQTLVGKTNSLTASGSFMDLSPYMSVIKQNMEITNAPTSWDVELLGRQKIGENGLLKAFSHAESSSLSVNQDQFGERAPIHTTIENKYQFSNLNYKNIINEKWSYYGGISISNNIDNITLDSTQINRKTSLSHLKGVIVHDYSDRFSYKNGIESYFRNYQEGLDNFSTSRDIIDTDLVHFIEADYYFSKKLVLRAGLRNTYNNLLDKAWSNPRSSLAYKLNSKSQISFAFGKYSQLAENKIRVQNKDLTNSTAFHYILNYMFSWEGRTFRGEVFQKNYSKLLTYDTLDGFNYSGLDNAGSGYAKGLDLFYRDNKTLKNTDFWITYSFVDSHRNFKNYESKVTPNFSPKHNASVVMKHFVQALHSQIGFSYSWNSGYPFHNPNKEGEMQDLTKDFQNLSLSWSYLPKPNLIIHFECSNVLGNKNIFGYQFSNTRNTEGDFSSKPIGQVADRFLFLGVFLTLSKDKNANQLNNL